MTRNHVRWPALAVLALVAGCSPALGADHTSAALYGHVTAAASGLDDPHEKDIAMQVVSSAENSSLDWRAQYKYIEDIGDGRGYTAGIIGFCSGTGDLLQVVEHYTDAEPGNILAGYLPALRA